MDPMGNGMCTTDYKNSSTILSISFYISLWNCLCFQVWLPLGICWDDFWRHFLRNPLVTWGIDWEKMFYVLGVPEKQIPANCDMIGLNMGLKPCESTLSPPSRKLFRDYPRNGTRNPAKLCKPSTETIELFRLRERYVWDVYIYIHNTHTYIYRYIFV